MDLQPLPGKVLIKPDPTTTTTESGIELVEHWPMEVSGVVVAIGQPKHPRKDFAFAAARELDAVVTEFVSGRLCCLAASKLLRDLTGRESDVAVGDRVVFGLSAGQEIRIEDARYFLLNDSDLLAVVPPESDVAA